MGLFERDEDVHRSSMNNIRRLEEECYNRRKHQMYMVLFRQAEKSYNLELQSIETEKSAAVEVTQSQVRSNGQDQTSTKNTDKSYDKMKHVLIIGDSMIKHIDPKKLSKKVVQKRSFPGKKIEEIHNEIDNIYMDAEISHVIIHAGTNNLPSESVDSCVSKIQKLALKSRRKFHNSKIGISSLTHREDINISAKLTALNRKLKEMANSNGFVYIDNSHIDETCLSQQLY